MIQPLRHSPRLKFLLVLTLMSMATVLAYGDALRLPFFFDDMTHYVWLHGQTLVSIFLSAAGRPYYRPLQFFLWKLYETLTGADSVVLYHALSLVVHIINAALVVILVRRLTRDRWGPALLAGLIFTFFPFSYQVVTLSASFTHPMVALFTLLAVLCYDQFRRRERKRWLIAALASGLLAFGSNEGSLFLAGLIALVEWTQSYPRKQWRWSVLFAAMAVLFYVWYQTRLHETSTGPGLRSLETIFQNAVYALQGLTFPLQPLGRVLMAVGLSDQAAVLIIGVSTLVVLVVIFMRAKQFRRFAFGVGWYAVCLLPPVLILSHDYFINAPRVLYLGSIGVAWLWASTVAIIGTGRYSVALRQGLAVVVALGVLVPSFIFIRQRMDLHNLNAAPLNKALAAAQESGPNARLLFVNLPAWISSTQAWYPIGHEGALFMPSYSTMAEFVSTNLNRPAHAQAAKFTNLAAPQLYYYGMYGGAPLDWDQLAARVNEADRVYFTLYSPSKIELVAAGQVTNTTAGSAPHSVAAFGKAATLEEADWFICDDRLNVRLLWSAASGGDWHVFVHVLNPDGTLAAQHDSPPLMGLRPFWQWSQGDRVEDIHPIDLTNLLADRMYTIVVGLYDPGSGQRLTATTTNGEQPSDQAVRIGRLTIGATENRCR